MTNEQGQAAALTEAAMRYRAAGKLRDAVLHCDAAIRARPDFAPAWLERAFVLSSGGSMVAATASYEQVLILDPGNAHAHAGIASIAARDGEGDRAREHAERALTADPFNAIAACALATVSLEANRPDEARALLAPLVEAISEAGADRSRAYHLLGEALDKLDRTAEAFAAYAASKRDFAAIHAERMAPPRATHRDFVDMIRKSVESLSGESWKVRAPAVTGAAQHHVFLIGFPRSGTTLVENILASLPGASALEERPTLAAADEAFLADAQGISKLAALDQTTAAQFAEAYWAKVHASGAEPGSLFIDMDPLKGTRLPLISKLFPKAKVVIMRRDPRDVVWSCFRTNFALSSAAYEFTDLARTAAHYDAMMQLTQTCLSRLPLDVYELRYDALVHEFDTTTRALCAAIGIEWTAEIRAFDKTAKRRGVSTASVGQVRKGLYDGTRQWERYRAQLAPVLPALAPWVERFGFAA
jgi:tetratricopeptide (TPR) repeat protein